jgi:hypothetical protein
MNMNVVFGRSRAPLMAALVLVFLRAPTRPGDDAGRPARRVARFRRAGRGGGGRDRDPPREALVDAPSLSLSITLPDGVDLVSGTTTWDGAARAGDIRTLTLTIRPRKAAPAVIQGAVMLKFADGTTLGDARSLMLPLGDPAKHKLNLPRPRKPRRVNRSSNIATSRDLPCRGVGWRAAALAGLAGLMGVRLRGGGTPDWRPHLPGEGVVVGGKVTLSSACTARRVDRRTDCQPVRYGAVRSSAGTAAWSRPRSPIRTGRTAPTCPLTSFSTVYPRVVSKTDPQKFDIFVIGGDQDGLYSRPGDPFDASKPGIYKRDFPLPLMAQISGYEFPFSGAFNVMDVLTTGAEKAVALTGQAPSERLHGVWTPGSVFGSGTVGTYFGADEQTDNAFIVLSGGAAGGPDLGDHDEYDDDVILHEFGHFMAYSFSKPAEIGGPHYLNDNTQDIRLSWSEGWV